MDSVKIFKNILYDLGWDGKKTKKVRKLLHDLKQFDMKNANVTMIDMKTLIRISFEEDFLIFHIREPEEIQKLVEHCIENDVKAYTIFIDRKKAKKKALKKNLNKSDLYVENYIYDFYLSNNKSKKKFKTSILKLTNDLELSNIVRVSKKYD